MLRSLSEVFRPTTCVKSSRHKRIAHLRQPPVSRNLKVARRSVRLLIAFGCLFLFSMKQLRARKRKFAGGTLFNHVARAITGTCPTLDDVLHTPGSAYLVEKVWKDPTCSSGCALTACVRLRVPCCVNTKEVGTLNEAIFVCSRQLDNSLLHKLYTGNLVNLVEYCRSFLSLKMHSTDCSSRNTLVPRTVYTINHSDQMPRNILATKQANPDYVFHHMSDSKGLEFVLSHCGKDVALAYQCIKPPAFRADLFRFCALYAKGGVYIDADIYPLVKVDDMISKCSSFSLGYDQAQRRLDMDHIGMQMKILAGKPYNNISKCMISSIVGHVRLRRQFTKDTLGFSGPQLLRKCYIKFPEDAAITYMDTRGADWPYAGLRASEKVFAYEIPSKVRHFQEIVGREFEFEYNDMVKSRDLYTHDCRLF